MNTLLRIDASIRLAGSTRMLTTYFEEAWLRANPDGKVIRRCLVSEPVPHLTQKAYKAFHSVVGSVDSSSVSDTLIRELERASHILIGSPLYNLSLPSPLKAYFDHVVRHGATFEVEQDCYRGLLEGKRATLITARGGFSTTDDADDFQTGYLKQILGFIGITQVEAVALEGTAAESKHLDEALSRAKWEIDQLLEPAKSLTWLGEFGDHDRQEIESLRLSQAEAIMAGDACAYADLCTEDVQLLIPEQDLTSGKDAFFEAERALFSSADFISFRKMPERVEFSGDLAIETGRQEVQVRNQNHAGGVFSANQKYTHIFRRTTQGWRYAVLMSNPSE